MFFNRYSTLNHNSILSGLPLESLRSIADASHWSQRFLLVELLSLTGTTEASPSCEFLRDYMLDWMPG